MSRMAPLQDRPIFLGTMRNPLVEFGELAILQEDDGPYAIVSVHPNASIHNALQV